MSQKSGFESTTVAVNESSGSTLIKKRSAQEDESQAKGSDDQSILLTKNTKCNLIRKRPKPESPCAEGGAESGGGQKQDVMSPKRVGVKIMSPMLKNQPPLAVSIGNNANNRVVRNSSESVRQHKATALELRSRGLLPRYCKNIPLKNKYLEMILDGSKVIEGRINSGMPAQCRPNDFILFFSGDVCCLTKVKEKTPYPTFREMLAHHGIRACLPDFKGNLDAAEKLYRSFPGYAEKEKKFGVLSLDVQLASPAEMKAMMQEREGHYNDNRGKADRGGYGHYGSRHQRDGDRQGDRHHHSSGSESRHVDRRGDGDGDFRRDRRPHEVTGSGAARRDRSRSRDRDRGRNGW
jgi:ASC-1-like (ASCH) protein